LTDYDLYDKIGYMKRRVGGSEPEDLVEPMGQTRLQVQLSFRLRPADADSLRTLADRAGVGPSTLGRLIVERYLADHPVAPQARRKGGRHE
jgi:hypothetical protein